MAKKTDDHVIKVEEEKIRENMKEVKVELDKIKERKESDVAYNDKSMNTDLMELLERTLEAFSQSENDPGIYSDKEYKLGLGIKRFGFVTKAFVSMMGHPSLASKLTRDEFYKSMNKVSFLQKFYDLVIELERAVAQALVYYADKCYRFALDYYAAIKSAAKNHVRVAEIEYELLKPYFEHHKKEDDPLATSPDVPYPDPQPMPDPNPEPTEEEIDVVVIDKKK